MYYLKALRDIFTEIFQENKFQRKLFDAKSRNNEIKHKKIRKIVILFISHNFSVENRNFVKSRNSEFQIKLTEFFVKQKKQSNRKLFEAEIKVY